MTASARTQSWLKVMYEENKGWIAGWLVDEEGDCDWAETNRDGPAIASGYRETGATLSYA